MSREELIEKTDEAITDLVFDKFTLQKAYNYYNGKRDPEQFKYLEDNYGIGSPTSVEFTPLLKKHVDALVGEYLGVPILPKISCKDPETISNITREKQLLIANELTKFFKNHLSNNLLAFINGKNMTDTLIKEQLDKIIESVEQNFISQYEIAAQNIVEYIMQSRDTDIVTKLRQLLTDLLITGYTYFRVKPTSNKTNIQIEVLNPLNTFVDENPESPYVKNSYRCVVRHWLTKSQILAKYGKNLSRADIKLLKEQWGNDSLPAKYYRSFDTVVSNSEDVQFPLPGYPEENYSLRRHQFLPVYEVEWIETDDDYIMQRYSTIRIGEEIFILNGHDSDVIRSIANPAFCTLSVNGVQFLNRDQAPYSLILECAHLQDRYDTLIYYRDALIANSGTSGSIMDVSLIPASLGVSWPERVQKWIAYKKAGIQWIDTTQEGRNELGTAPINTIFNGFDDTLKAQSIQAIEIAIQSIEQTVSSITGVFRERLNGIEQRDAVTNIKQGVTNSFIITKHYYQQMDLVVCEMLLDALNLSKKVFRQGLTGTLILGEKYQKIFTALPQYFTLTDFDIHITSSTQVMEDLMLIKQMIPDFIKSGSLDPDIIFEALTTKSLADLKYKVKKAMQIRKQENNQLQQLSEKLEETTQQAEQLSKELEKAKNQIAQLNDTKLKIEQERINLEYQVNWYKAQTDRTYKEGQIEIDRKRTDIEIAQLTDGNPYNDEIKNIR